MKSTSKVRSHLADVFVRAYRLVMAGALVALLLSPVISQPTLASDHATRTRHLLAKVKSQTAPQDRLQFIPRTLPSSAHSEVQTETGMNKWLLLAIKIGVIGLVIAAFAVFVSFRLFSPNGLLNRLAKEDYIPSQFKSQHKKHLAELVKAAARNGLPLGTRTEGMLHKLMPQKLALPNSARQDNPHVVLLGAGGKGKSRMMANLIWHDITAGDRAVVVIDSEGGLVDSILKRAGDEMDDRIVLIDPSRRIEFPYAFNPLALDAEQDPQLIANNIVLGFKAIYQEQPGRQQAQDQWNAQTANILRNAVMLLMANRRTLADLPMLLSENDFRDLLLQNIERQVQPGSAFSTVLDAWAQYRRLARTEQWISWVEPILNRVQPVLSDARVKAALTDGGEAIDLEQIIAERKILCVRIPQGQLDQSANLLGSLIVTGLRQSAIALNVSEGEIAQCALYVDELDKFVDNETFGFMAAESRRYGIGITGALRTLQSVNEIYRNNILANVGTICTFALARKDAELLGPQMFRVDGRRMKHRPLSAFFNPVNSTPAFEQVGDEEKLNIDRLIGLDKQHYFCYRVGTIAGVTRVRAHDFGYASLTKSEAEPGPSKKKAAKKEPVKSAHRDARKSLYRESSLQRM